MIRRSLGFGGWCTMIYGYTSSTEYDILGFQNSSGVEELITTNLRMQGLDQV